MPTVQPYSATAQLKSLAGTVALPGITFTGDTDTGLYSPAANQVAITTGGVQRLLIGSDGSITLASPLLFPLGSAAAPSVSFTGDTNTGIYSPGADQVSVATGGTERLRIDAAGQIEAVSLGTAAAPIFSFTTDPNTGIYSPGADQLAISTGGSGRLFVDASGRLGIGTSSPNYTLDVAGTINANATVRTSNGTHIGILGSEAFAAGVVGVGSTSNHPLVLGTNSLERLRITSAGLVGVGTSVPQSQLHVLNQIRVSDSTQSQGSLVLGDGGSTAFNVGIARWNINTGSFGAGGIGYFSQGTGNIGGHYFYTGDAAVGSQTARMVITPAGLVGVGTSSPASLLSVVKAAEGTSLEALRLVNESPNQRSTSSVYIGMYGSNEAYERARILCGNPTDFDGNNGFLSFWTRSSNTLSERLRITSAGLVGIGTSSPTQLLTVIGSSFVGSSFNGQTIGDGSAERIRIGYKDGNPDTGLVPAQILTDATTLSIAARDIVNSAIRFHTGSGTSERLRITSAGLVGVGTSSPEATIDINATTASLRVNSSTGTNYALVASQNGTGACRLGVESSTGGSLLAGATSYSSILCSSSSHSLHLGTNATTALTIDTAQRVGIGTIGPEDRLDLGSGYLRFKEAIGGTGTYGAIRAFNTLANTNPATSIRFIRDVANVGNDGAICFDTVNSERARIDSSGSFGIGTSSPNGRLDVADGDAYITKNSGGDASGVTSQSLYIRTQSGNLARLYSVSQGSGGPGGFGGDFRIQTKADNGALADRFTINYLGSVGIGTTSPGDVFDIAAGNYRGITIKCGTTTNRPTLSFFNTADSLAAYIQAIGSSLAFGRMATDYGDHTESARLDSSGRLLVGTSSNNTTFNSRLQVKSDNTTAGGIVIDHYENDTSGGIVFLAKSRSATVGTMTVVQNGDTLGEVQFWGADGTQHQQGASIKAQVDGTPGASDMPGRLVFSTTADGAASPTERLRITSAGLVGIGTSSPQVALQVGGTTAASQVRIYGGSAGSTYPELQLYAASSDHNWTIRGNHSTNLTIGKGTFGNYGSDLLTLTAGGSLGIGTTSPSYLLDVASSVAQVGNSTDAFIQYKSTAGNWHVGANSSNAYVFYAGTYGSGTERARIDSSGRLLVGTSSARSGFFNGAPVSPSLQVEGTSLNGSAIALVDNENGTTGGGVIIGRSRGTTLGSFTILQNNDSIGSVGWHGADGSDFVEAARIEAVIDGTPGANDMPGRLVFSTTADGASSPTERMRIDNAGSLIYGTSTSPGADITSGTGFYYQISTGFLYVRSNGSPVAAFNRGGNDGTLVEFKQDQTTEGTISVSGTTVSYNGAHLSRWSQLPSGAERTEILRGSVLSNIDEMCEWGNEDNEQLNRMKVSDVEGDKNVSGVFQAWDDDDDTYTNDFYCAMTGDFIIRIGAGVTVERGDLLMSAGDGTAKPQNDDIIRSKTIAKVTSTNVSCTYGDGSYCVPCVLMAC